MVEASPRSPRLTGRWADLVRRVPMIMGTFMVAPFRRSTYWQHLKLDLHRLGVLELQRHRDGRTLHDG